MGEAIGPTLNPAKGKFWLQMGYACLWVYSSLAIVMVIFAIYLATRHCEGYRPVALGHIQTLADLVDEWRTSDR